MLMAISAFLYEDELIIKWNQCIGNDRALGILPQQVKYFHQDGEFH